MNTYLAIITTALVITQIIRVIQNTIQLTRFNNKMLDQNKKTLDIWDLVEKAAIKYLDEDIDYSKKLFKEFEQFKKELKEKKIPLAD